MFWWHKAGLLSTRRDHKAGNEPIKIKAILYFNSAKLPNDRLLWQLLSPPQFLELSSPVLSPWIWRLTCIEGLVQCVSSPSTLPSFWESGWTHKEANPSRAAHYKVMMQWEVQVESQYCCRVIKKFSARCASTQCSGSVHVVSWVFSLRAVCWQPHPAGKFQALSIIKNVRHAGHADTLPSEFGLFYCVAILITSDDPLLKLDEFKREVDICSVHKFLVFVVSLWLTCEKIV